MHLKSAGYTDTVLLPTAGNVVNGQTPDIGKLDIYRQNRLGKSAANFGNFWTPG